MKRIIGAFVVVFCWCASACADCAAGYFAVGGDCVESKFTVTTTELAADTTFAFYMSAKGTFYVDWGDGTVDTITRTDTDETLYDHTYSTAGVKTIRFGGIATEYSTVFGVAAISFRRNDKLSIITGSLGALLPMIGNGATAGQLPSFYATFASTTNLRSIPANLFSGITHSQSYMFWDTFANSGITGIPETLFAGITSGSRYALFDGTFRDCTSLTAIPEHLFDSITDSGYALFWQTFDGCTGVTSIPKNLFANLRGANKWMFYRTFSGCTGLRGYIPPELFAGLNGETAANMFTDTFRNTNLYTSCPCGTTQYETGYESAWSGKVSCTVGLKPNEHWYNGTCTTVCAAGVTEMKTSTGLAVPLITTKLTTPSINVAYNGSTCFIPLAVGAAANAINMSWDETDYHTVMPDDITPTGFTGQPY